MATVLFKGNQVVLSGNFPEKGSKAQEFKLVAADLSEKSLADFQGKKKILSIVPSLDTPVCATSARTFNKAVSELGDTVVLNISADLPFASSRFCETEGIKDVLTLSTFRNESFSEDYGVKIADGPLSGLTTRAVVVLDQDNNVVYSELVPEIAQEPDYDSALKAIAQIGS